jgi:hypothetical protein
MTLWFRALLLSAVLLVALVTGPVPGRAQSSLSEGFAAGEAGLSPAARAGREIWFFATAGNARFHAYVFPQRLGAAIDWYRILAAKDRERRFTTWGLINDPDCCVPGSPNCPAESLEETYGFDWCPGDADLLAHVGKTGYRDPACDFEDAPLREGDPQGAVDQRQSPCDLAFGTSTGALGFRKFPNPRFDRARWQQLNGSLATWEGYRQSIVPYEKSSGDPDTRNNRLLDGSIEPPFLIGMACGGCHIAFDPLQPPADPEHPHWDNILGTVGNQYLRISEMLGSGMPPSSIEWQMIARARPGVVDTSALPNDGVTNPGTMNAIINFGKRPLHEHVVTRWHKAGSCPAGAAEDTCWCEPDKPGKCWERLTQTEMVPNILKGGEDSIGFEGAVQRVYFNIGSCSEQCFVNHIPDLRQADPRQRNFGQSPFDIGQCRRDCPNFRAIEDRLADVVDFLVTARPSDLYQARGYDDPRDLEVELEADFGEGAIARGREVFAANCARCHSSQAGPFDANTDFHKLDPADSTLRVDFLGNDEPTPVTEVGTYDARALHSNHMESRIWQQFGSETLRARPPVENLDELRKGGGRGYYRNISLLSVWAHAPFMHNNALGPELCGHPGDPLYISPYVDAEGKPLPPVETPPCVPYDPSVDGRFALFEASMEQLLNPDRRTPKITTVSEELIVDIAPKMQLGDIELGFSLRVPPGVPQSAIGDLRHKDLIDDSLLLALGEDRLRAKYARLLSGQQIDELITGLRAIRKDVLEDGGGLVKSLGTHWPFVETYYSNSKARIENAGHRFGEDLSDADKKALTAFLATL